MSDDGEESVIFTTKVELNSENIERVSLCPVYLQNRIRKKGDVRVTIVGNKIFSAFIHSQQSEQSETDWRKTDTPLPHSLIQLPYYIEVMCLQLTKELSLNFAAIKQKT